MKTVATFTQMKQDFGITLVDAYPNIIRKHNLHDCHFQYNQIAISYVFIENTAHVNKTKVTKKRYLVMLYIHLLVTWVIWKYLVFILQ